MKRTRAQFEASRMSTVDLLTVLDKPAIRAMLADADADPRLVGRWVWIEFADKPSDRIRQFLKAVGFRWNRKRSAWQHSCGFATRHSPGDPRRKYGSFRVFADDGKVGVA